MKPKISIIVPIFNMEKYLEKCLDSILAQNLKDFELILVNDGSEDSSGLICDEYAKNDKRIKVIQQHNSGLSAARNTGIDNAKGDYIGFVDSDDWIEPDMYEVLYNLCIKHNCEISNISSFIHYPNKTIINLSNSFYIHTRKEALESVIKGEPYDEVVWTKLYKRELFNNLRFQKGFVYEDTAFTYKAIDKCNKVCFLGIPKYHYIKHSNSSMDKAKKNLLIDGVIIYEEMLKYVNRFHPELNKLVIQKLVYTSINILNLIVKESATNINVRKYKIVITILNKYYFKSINNINLPIKIKLLLTFSKINPYLYKFIIKNYKRWKTI